MLAMLRGLLVLLLRRTLPMLLPLRGLLVLTMIRGLLALLLRRTLPMLPQRRMGH